MTNAASPGQPVALATSSHVFQPGKCFFNVLAALPSRTFSSEPAAASPGTAKCGDSSRNGRIGPVASAQPSVSTPRLLAGARTHVSRTAHQGWLEQRPGFSGRWQEASWLEQGGTLPVRTSCTGALVRRLGVALLPPWDASTRPRGASGRPEASVLHRHQPGAATR